MNLKEKIILSSNSQGFSIMFDYSDVHKYVSFETAQKNKTLVKKIFHTFDNYFFRSYIAIDHPSVDKKIKQTFREIENRIDDQKLIGQFKISMIVFVNKIIEDVKNGN